VTDPLAPWRGVAGALIPVRVTPRAKVESMVLDASADGTPRLLVHLRAVPEDGKANAALCSMLARALGVPKSRVSVQRGATSREKLVAIA
jgi:uncharacterized protein YggU (UPF0235/DUF167 family)